MKNIKILSTLLFSVTCIVLQAQPGASKPGGKLFIIGGGDRPPSLMQSLVAEAGLQQGDYVVVLPMSSERPDTAYHYFKADLAPYCPHPILNFHFTAANVNDTQRLDSVQRAKLIFITGGDQERFMNVVLNTPLHTAIRKAWQNGATIAGTSAGAAVMSEHMITGRELTDTTYRATFRKIEHQNIETKPGLALLSTAVIDQHFIVRSRYNRLLSAIAKFPTLACIGIDEETAIVVQGNKAKVVGESQVVVLKKPEDLKVISGNLIKLKDLQFSIYTANDEFELK